MITSCGGVFDVIFRLVVWGKHDQNMISSKHTTVFLCTTYRTTQTCWDTEAFLSTHTLIQTQLLGQFHFWHMTFSFTSVHSFLFEAICSCTIIQFLFCFLLWFSPDHPVNWSDINPIVRSVMAFILRVLLLNVNHCVQANSTKVAALMMF